ncbi:hypothetical protein MKZ38_009768 [Zalerion maritima]|uniref:Integral membrane protein n=1 Tax=Zalerion maritima TaxID=339359 RepID=A0AAD5WXV6_9PEZI|nr:hypothetical protein MKZ38_009768 [Zalerion maritima]
MASLPLSDRMRPLLKDGLRPFNTTIPPLLRPLIRAYMLGYASAVAPRVLTLMLQYLSRRKNVKGDHDATRKPFLHVLWKVVRKGFDLQRFPAFCAALVGGSTLLQARLPVGHLVARWAKSLSTQGRSRLTRWISTFVAAWLSLLLLQSKQTASFTDTIGDEVVENGIKPRVFRYAGRTLDLSLFAVVRAVDVVVGTLWSRRKAQRMTAGDWSKVDSLLSRLVDPAIFATSSALIMWTWIYLPDRLPQAYNKWITSAAAVDGRLTEALRRLRSGELRYGERNGQEILLQPMCAEYKVPLEWGDPAKAIPFPCELVHMGCGPSCEVHALSRFYRSFRWAMTTYLPLTLALQLRKSTRVYGIKTATISAMRSSAFLGGFITLFYYGVCLARTRLGPHILGKDTDARVKIDGGLCVGVGCALCGWSILIEKAGRRNDMALFVAPRALATCFPRRYSLEKQWRENLAFAFSTAIVFTSVMEDKESVRGVFGKLLGKVMEQPGRPSVSGGIDG